MKIFEFHFNPKSDENIIFDDFCYEPENAYDKRLGGIYLLGFLKNTLPHNKNFLNNLAKIIKENFYQSGVSDPDKALKQTLKKANEHLEKIAKAGDVSWLGNLNYAALTIKKQELNFTKVGNIKVYLLRKGQVVDIDQRLKFEEIEPYPLKVFGKIISGKLLDEDTILVLNKEVANFFVNQKLLYQIADLVPFDDKRLKEIFENKRDKFSDVKGLCLLIHLSQNFSSKRREDIFAKTKKGKFSFKKAFNPLLKYLQKTKNSLREKLNFKRLKSFALFKIFKKNKTRKIKKIAKQNKKRKKVRLGIKLPKIDLANLKELNKNRPVILIIALIIFLSLGFLIFESQTKNKEGKYQKQLEAIEEKTAQADSYLMLADLNPQAKDQANKLLKEAWGEASSMPEFSDQVTKLKNDIKQSLYALNGLEFLENIQPIFNFDAREFIPHKLISQNNNLYFFSPYTNNILELNNENEKNLIQTEIKIDGASLKENSILFFQKPNKVLEFKANELSPLLTLETPGFKLDNFSSYRTNLYFLEKISGEIIKYSDASSPQLWLGLATPKTADAESLAIDGAIWILDKDNIINKYYLGQLNEAIKLDIFPEVKDLIKIYTSPELSYLYLLEPGQQRIIILNKQGLAVKQYQSQQFNNLLDFSVSNDGKTIYLLNGLELFKIETN